MQEIIAMKKKVMILLLVMALVMVGCLIPMEPGAVAKSMIQEEEEALALSNGSGPEADPVTSVQTELLSAERANQSFETAEETLETAARESAETTEPTEETPETAAPESAERPEPTEETQETVTAESADTTEPTEETQETATAKNAETAEPTEAPEEAATAETTETTEPTEETEEAATTETAERAEPMEEKQESDTESARDTEDAEEIETAEQTEEIPDTEEILDTEDSADTDDFEDIEDYDTPLGAKAFLYEYEKTQDGTLVLDENGDPLAILQPGRDIPKAWLRNEAGELVLDRKGNPIATQTVPAEAVKIKTLQDQLNPNRSIDIYATFDEQDATLGATARLTAVLNGYDNLIYALQWQQSNDGDNWTDLVSATHSSLEIETSEENANDFWRLLVIITGFQG